MELRTLRTNCARNTSKTAIHRHRAAWVEKYGPDAAYIHATQDKLGV